MDQAGDYKVYFAASDGKLTSTADMDITVRNVPAQELTSDLAGYINGLDINEAKKNLLYKEINDVTSSLGEEQYKLALVKLKVFMLEVKILAPGVITIDQADNILKSCIDITLAINADAQGKDKSWVDNKAGELISKIAEFKKNKITSNVWDEIINQIDELSKIMK